MDTMAIAIRTLQLFCFFPLICYLEHFVGLYSLLFSDLCVQIVSFVNERFTNHSTCCLVLRFLFVPPSSFSFAMHSKDEGKSSYFCFHFGTFDCSFLFQYTRIPRNLIVSYYITLTQVRSIIGSKSDALLNNRLCIKFTKHIEAGEF